MADLACWEHPEPGTLFCPPPICPSFISSACIAAPQKHPGRKPLCLWPSALSTVICKNAFSTQGNQGRLPGSWGSPTPVPWLLSQLRVPQPASRVLGPEKHTSQSHTGISAPGAHGQITTPERRAQTWGSLPPLLFPIPQIYQGNPVLHRCPNFLEFHEHK